MCIRDSFNGSEMVEVLTESNQSLDSLEALCSKYRIERGIVATVVDLNAVSYTHIC